MTDVRVRIKDTSTTRQRFTDSQIQEFFAEGQRDIVNKTWCVYNSTTFVSLQNTTYYALPSDAIIPYRVTYGQIVLPESSLFQIDSLNNDVNWGTQGGLPQMYWTEYSHPATATTPYTTIQIGLYPFPITNTTTASVHVAYYALPADLVNVTDVPFNGETRLQPYHYLLVLFATIRVYLIEGEMDKVDSYEKEYDDGLQAMANVVGQKPNFLPSAAGPATSRQ